MNYNQPYFGNGIMPNNYGYQPVYGFNAQSSQPTIQSQVNPIQKPIQPDMALKLQGKSVDSIDVVKAMDIPLDGSVTYFPLTDGTAIVTKQLQPDGTSKIVVYKPIEMKEEEKVKDVYITEQQLEEKLSKLNNLDLKDDIKTMKRQIKDLTEDMKEVNETLSNRKD